MPIEKGEAWGAAGELPTGAPIAAGDAVAAALIGKHETIGLRAGDLARTLGIREPYSPTGPKHLAPVDAIVVELDDGSTHRALAHVLIGHPLWTSECTALMNAAFIGQRNMAPRAHPGDDKIDMVTFALSPVDRLKAWRRMATASHLPHPGISTKRRSEGTVEMTKPRKVVVDGRAVGSARELSYHLEPGAITIAI